ncbi:hypothetical protein [Leucothrix pacifica]|uniref:Uncharacterized protein n=1 Tax=Leucothrix pacifica TaxID=1247513 RepID=A0A317C8T3_9GAMM|nr:hypothetical protein [Leucothrix pacifica]PWQ92542.1 hypothetical protein DKW60_20680 [Leucothrix pacifica]
MTALVIIFAAIVGAVLSVYLRRLNSNNVDEIPHDAGDENHHYDPSNPQTTILHEISPDSADVKTLYEVFSWGREASAEYLYYGEIDSSAVKQDGTGDLTKAAFHAEVSVSFEEDAISVETANLKDYRHHGFKSPRFSIDNEIGDNFPNLTPAELIPTSTTDEYRNLISISDKDYSHFMIVGVFQMVYFRYVRIDDSRITTISVIAGDEFATMEWLFQHFNDLVERYQDLPMQRFSGAIRE